MKQAQPNGRQGITLVETLVYILVFVIVITLVFGAIVNFYKTRSFAFDQVVAIDEARIGIKTMTREIREARTGDDGSYPIERADDKEFIFYSDIDKDGAVERVRYFIGAAGSKATEQECVTLVDGGSCNVIFSNFFSGTLISAQIKVSVEGDFGWNNQEYAQVEVDGEYQNDVCRTGCTDCPAIWQGDRIFDVTTAAGDNYLDVLLDATSSVNDFCDWIDQNHSMKVKVKLSWEEDSGIDHELKKGVTNPTSNPVSYPPADEEVSIISSYIRNGPAIFEYYDSDGNKIIGSPAKLSDTKVIKVYLEVNVNSDKAPENVEMESYIQLRNLKDE